MTERIVQALGVVVAWVSLTTCAGVQPEGVSPAEPAYTELPSVRGITITGRVTLSGSLPRYDPIPVYRDSDFCGEALPSEEVMVETESRTIEGVVVSLDGVARGKPLPKEQTRVIESRGCRFIPRVSAMVVHSLLAVQSVDPIMHNTHIRLESRFGDTVANVVQPTGSRGIQRRIGTSGLLDVRCDIHPFMRAFIHVFEHPYFAVTDAAGRFEMSQVPAGSYTLRLWHERLRDREEPITVPEQGPMKLDLEMGLKR